MKLQDQVNTKEQGDKLRALGITAQSHFYWMRDTMDKWVVHVPHFPDFPQHYADDYAPAFTVAELGAMLMGCSIFPEWRKIGGKYSWNTCVGPRLEDVYADAPTEAQARAQLLIRLLEKGSITPAEANEAITPEQVKSIQS